MDIFDLSAKLSLDTSEYTAGVEQAKGEAQSLESEGGVSFSSFASGAVVALSSVTSAVLAVTAAVVNFTLKSAENSDHIDKQAQILGISRQAYQEWDYVLSQNGASIDSMGRAFRTLNGELDTMNQQADTTGTAFERLGLTYEDLQGMNSEQAFAKVITSLQSMTNQTERTAIAVDIFGNSATQLSPLLNSTADDTNALIESASELGLVLDDDVIDAGVELNDTFDTMKRTFSAVFMDLAGTLMPIITDFIRLIQDNMPYIQQTLQTLAPVAVNLLQSILPLLFEFVNSLLPPLVDLINVLLPVAIQIVQAVLPIVQNLLIQILEPLTELVDSLLPLLMNLLLPILDILEPYTDYISSLLDLLLLILPPLIELLNIILPPLVTIISDVLIVVLETVVVILGTVAEVLENVFNKALEECGPQIEAFKNGVQTAFEAVEGVIDRVSNWIQTNLHDRILQTKDDAVNTFFAMKDLVTEIFEQLWENIKSSINWILGGIETMANGVVNGVNTVINALNALDIDVPDWVTETTGVGSIGFDIPTIPSVSLPRLATGGIVTSATVLEAGEDGAEAIVPLEKHTEWTEALADNLQVQEQMELQRETISLLQEILETIPTELRLDRRRGRTVTV